LYLLWIYWGQLMNDLDDRQPLITFLEAQLPKKDRPMVESIMASLEDAARRHDRFFEGREGWMKYGQRRVRLKEVRDLARKLQRSISGLDVISRYDLNIAISNERMNALSSALADIEYSAEEIQRTIQTAGKPTNLDAKRWINEVADIYETCFRQPPKIWGSGSSPKRSRGPFYKLLELSIPAQFPRHGGLEPATIRRALKEREKPKENR
jgi:hypothetical protein